MSDDQINAEIGALPELLGTTEVGLLIGWDRRKVSVYLERGKLPKPATHVGKRPFWTKNQILQWLSLHGSTAPQEIKSK
jgi:hypothetical protein